MRLREAALIGTGHIGGSLMLALRREGVIDESRGYDRDPAAAARAVERGIIDYALPSAVAAAAGASLVVIATPVGSIADVARALAAAGAPAPGALVIDVGSVKGGLVDEVERALADGARFVGCHPLAGREHTGPDAADADLFRDRPCLLTPTPRTDPTALADAIALWTAVGARPETMDADAHDALVALSSHLPHVASFALAAALDGAVDERAATAVKRLGGGSLHDGTRVAASDAAMWRDILLGNRERLLPLVARLAAEVAVLSDAIERSDGEALSAAIARARRGRSRLSGR